MNSWAFVFRVACIALLAASLDRTASAEAPQGTPPIKLRLESGEELGPGSVAVAEGIAGNTPVRFVLEGLDVAQPISLVVATADAATTLKVDVVKDSFADPQRSASTGQDGTVTVQFRTHGDFGFSVAAANGGTVRFMAAVWVGPIEPPATPSFLAPAKDYEPATLAALQKTTEAAASSANQAAVTPAAASTARNGIGAFEWALLAVGMLIAAGLLVVAVARLRRRPEATQAAARVIVVAIVLSSVTVRAQPTPGQGTNPGLAPTQPVPNPALAPTQPAPNPGLAPTQPVPQTGSGNPALAPTQPVPQTGSGNPALAPTDPAMPAARQIPAAPVVGNRNPNNAGEHRQITPRDIQQMRDDQQNEENRRVARERARNAGEHRQITPADLAEMEREAERARMRPFARNDNVRQMQRGRDIPTEEEAREMMRRSEALRERARQNLQEAEAEEIRTRQALRDSLERSRAAFQDALGRGITNAAHAANIAMQAWQILHPSDHTCIAQTAPANMPIVPSMCAGSAECSACYSEAYGRLNRTRGNLEKLRCIYNWNKEYAERAKSFGDNVSSIHGISGLAWQQERRKIERAMDQLGQTYDGKYRELLGYARQDLGSISACEARFFHNPDWATRYGFMFYGFLEDRYRR